MINVPILNINLSYRFIAFGYALIGVFALAMALVAEHVFGLLPCKLCIWQRWPYLAIIILGTIGYTVAKRKNAFATCLFFIMLCFIFGASVGVYQTGGEQGWWRLTADCSSIIDPSLSAQEYLEALKNAPTVPCDVVKWSLFGLSMASYNAIFSTIMAFLTGIFALRVMAKETMNIKV